MSGNSGRTAPTSQLRAFWQRLEGEVHPDDAPVLASNRHSFNLDFPPPAFVGNVDTARVFILRNNGGFDALETAREFSTAQDRREHI
jgi:hypothetical protein